MHPDRVGINKLIKIVPFSQKSDFQPSRTGHKSTVFYRIEDDEWRGYIPTGKTDNPCFKVENWEIVLQIRHTYRLYKNQVIKHSEWIAKEISLPDRLSEKDLELYQKNYENLQEIYRSEARSLHEENSNKEISEDIMDNVSQEERDALAVMLELLVPILHEIDNMT